MNACICVEQRLCEVQVVWHAGGRKRRDVRHLGWWRQSRLRQGGRRRKRRQGRSGRWRRQGGDGGQGRKFGHVRERGSLGACGLRRRSRSRSRGGRRRRKGRRRCADRCRRGCVREGGRRGIGKRGWGCGRTRAQGSGRKRGRPFGEDGRGGVARCERRRRCSAGAQGQGESGNGRKSDGACEHDIPPGM